MGSLPDGDLKMDGKIPGAMPITGAIADHSSRANLLEWILAEPFENCYQR
jgi:hypothetical protein